MNRLTLRVTILAVAGVGGVGQAITYAEFAKGKFPSSKKGSLK